MSNRDKRPVRQLKPVLHIFCEGSKTEPNYIEHYKDLFCKNKKASIVVEKTDKTTPIQLVEVAIQMKKSTMVGRNDEFWVVFDRESPIKYGENLHQRARDKAAANQIQIVISNVCFEVWLLMHFQSTCAACNACDELISRDEFRKWFPSYKKGVKCDLSVEQIMTARKNAMALNKRTKDAANENWRVPTMWNPYTNMYELLDAIDKFTR